MSLFRLLASSLALATLATGCRAMMRPASPTAEPAENPLVSGRTLEAKNTNTITGVTEADCKTWPFGRTIDDTVTVNVTEAEICVSVHKHKEEMASWHGEPTMSSSERFKIVNDANEGGYIDATKTGSGKVTSCFNKGYSRETVVWAFDYTGCAPNNGTVSPTTKSLRVGNQAWAFGSAEPAVGPSASKASADDHGDLSPEITRFHDALSPRWHAEKGPRRMKDTCAAVRELQADADQLTKSPPAGSNAVGWKTSTKELTEAVTALGGTCKANDAASFESAFERVHRDFHVVMEAGGGAKEARGEAGRHDTARNHTDNKL